MICPFRVGAEFTYTAIPDKDGNTDYLQKEQRLFILHATRMNALILLENGMKKGAVVE